MIAFYKNDPFFPAYEARQYRGSIELKNRFLEASEDIIKSKNPAALLPAIRPVEQINQI